MLACRAACTLRRVARSVGRSPHGLPCGIKFGVQGMAVGCRLRATANRRSPSTVSHHHKVVPLGCRCYLLQVVLQH